MKATNAEAVGAIRLALEGASTPEAATEVIQEIVDVAPATREDDKGAVRILVDAVKRSRARFKVPA